MPKTKNPISIHISPLKWQLIDYLKNASAVHLILLFAPIPGWVRYLLTPLLASLSTDEYICFFKGLHYELHVLETNVQRGPRLDSSQAIKLQILLKRLRTDRQDVAHHWCHHEEGVVYIMLNVEVLLITTTTDLHRHYV